MPRLCPGCGSLERHRVFCELLKLDFGRRVLMNGASVFAIAPAAADRIVLEDAGVASFVSVDIRPAAKPDVVADICNMPQVFAQSYDRVMASVVLKHVHDLRAALSEIARILKPDGILLVNDSVQAGKFSAEFADASKITERYGEEVYAKYKVGTFRSFGDLDFEALFAPHFVVETFSGADVATGKRVDWYAMRKTAG